MTTEELLRKAATVLVSAGPALLRATNQSPNERAHSLNALLEGTADETYREIQNFLDKPEEPSLEWHTLTDCYCTAWHDVDEAAFMNSKAAERYTRAGSFERPA